MKFGGGALKGADEIRNAGKLVNKYVESADGGLVVVVSAMGKTTNALEQLADFAARGAETEAWAQYAKIYDFHSQIITELFSDEKKSIEAETYFNEIKRALEGILLLGDFSDRLYDRLMAYGELLASRIICAYLDAVAPPFLWADARKSIVTDTSFRRAAVLQDETRRRLKTQVEACFVEGANVVFPGFIGATADGVTTTLGREGSDYTAALVAEALGADSVIVWKDVPGVMSADPKKFPAARPIPALDYKQAVEATFYGATVIHPKTLFPLCARGVALEVKCFDDADLEGTRILKQESPPTFSLRAERTRQALVKVRAAEGAFLDGADLARILTGLANVGLQAYLLQQEAATLTFCCDDAPDGLAAFIGGLRQDFLCEIQRGYTLVSLLFPETPIQYPENAVLFQKGEDFFRYLVKSED